MEMTRVKELLRELNIKVVPKEAMKVRGFDVDTYRGLAKQTEKIDYDCDFNNGVCQVRALGGYGCCWHCAESFGYWRKEGGMIDEDTLGRIAGYYDPQKGFLKEGEGCVLPRELRSPTCLYIYCSDDMMSGEDKQLLYRIKNGAHWS